MNGVVDNYVITEVSVVFQLGAVDCAHCPLLETYSRKQCRKTGEYIVDDRTLGAFCPLNITQEDRDKIAQFNYEYLNTKEKRK